MKKYPDTTLVGVFPVKDTLLFGGSPMIYVFPQFVAIYRTVSNTEEKFDRVYLFDEHVNSSIVEFDEELLEHGDSERGYYEDDAPLVASQYFGHQARAYTVIDATLFSNIIAGHVQDNLEFKSRSQLIEWLPELADEILEDLELNGLKIKRDVRAYVDKIHKFEEQEEVNSMSKQDVLDYQKQRA